MVFKPFRMKDIRELLSWIKSEQALMQWAGPIFTWPVTQSRFRRHLESSKTEPASLYPFGLYRDSKIIGYCELSDHKRSFNCANVSRVIVSPKNRNKKLGEYMVGRLLTFGFEQLCLNRIGLGVFDFNAPAIKCYTKAGFKLEGTLRQSVSVGETYWNCHIMSILRDEWLKVKSYKRS